MTEYPDVLDRLKKHSEKWHDSAEWHKLADDQKEVIADIVIAIGLIQHLRKALRYYHEAGADELFEQADKWKWKPLKTAPQDGTPVLVYAPPRARSEGVHVRSRIRPSLWMVC